MRGLEPPRGCPHGDLNAGPEVADFIPAATVAVAGEVPLSKLVLAVPPFPARSELWLYFLEEYGL